MADLESPPSSPADDGPAQSAPAPDVSDAKPAPAESSPAAPETTGEPKSMVDAVHTALKPKDADEESPASQPDPTQVKDAPDAAKPGEQVASDELTDEEKTQLKGRTKKSFERLTTSLKEQGQQIETLQAKVGEYDRVIGYIKQTQLSPQDLDTLFDIGSTMKQGNPHEALRKVEPIYRQLLRMTGVDLPPDLTEQVRQGYLTEQHARELSMAKSAAQHAAAREQYQTELRVKTEQEANYKTHMSALVNTADEWERQKQGNDLDWNRKAARVHELAKLEVLEKGPPKSATDAVQMFNRIYDRVTSDLKAMMPRPSAVRAPNGGQSTSRNAVEPKSMLEAIRLGTRGTV